MTLTAQTRRAISSMATRQLLAELVGLASDLGVEWQIESVGGVDAARRVAAGEVFDLVLLASDAIDTLIEAGHLLAGSRVDWVRSEVVVAVPSASPWQSLSTEAQLREAVAQATSLGISTGPSGAYVEQLIRGWGMGDRLEQRRVVPPPGVPVGRLMAQGQVALGFQQRSEMMGLDGVRVLGPLPDPVGYTTVFSAGLPVALANDPLRRTQVEQFMAFLCSSSAAPLKLKHGMSALS